MVICSSKRREKPQYRLLESVNNGVHGGNWTQLKCAGNIIAVNGKF